MKAISHLLVNSLWPSDAIWWQGSRSTLVQVMACCLMAPSHYLNQCWLIITKVQWCSHLRTISLEISQPSVTKINLKIIFLRFYWNLPGANELRSICWGFPSHMKHPTVKWVKALWAKPSRSIPYHQKASKMFLCCKSEQFEANLSHMWLSDAIWHQRLLVNISSDNGL